jgi:hypothetical protein
MSYRISTIPPFDKDVKRLHKRYHSLADDLKQLTDELQQKPLVGADLGHGVRKIRMAIKSKGGGKKGGARVITYMNIVLEIEEGDIYMLALYDKADQDTISDKEIKRLLKEAGVE